VASFTGENLTGSRFEDVYLSDARFHDSTSPTRAFTWSI